MKTRSDHRAATAPARKESPSREILTAQGKGLRDKCPRRSHAGWSPPADRPDPVRLIEQSNLGRLPELIPIRYGRMLVSPFTFFRGAPAIMAADLSRTPATGVRVQACGDCHLLNFGGFATPERRLVFDINDFDETLVAPWEWDVKRLAASFVVAAGVNRFRASEARAAASTCVRAYRRRTAEFAAMRTLDMWYSRIDAEAVEAVIKEADDRMRLRKRIRKNARQGAAGKGFPKLTRGPGGRLVICDNPPLLFHRPGDKGREFEAQLAQALAGYRESLAFERRQLLDRYRLMDAATKVVGVGSVGTFCAVALLMAGPGDPLFLQVKEARASVLEPYAGESPFASRGERIVSGQRLMQSASDIFLGWTTGAAGRHFYVRQLRDMKLKPQVEVFSPAMLACYAELCGWALARAHARSGQAALISGYLGKSDRFEEAVADFAVAYAEQNERDYRALGEAARSGRIKVIRDA
ncbi:MAG: DUF2252 domain-containing protein [Verrucomicrobia bacterium]|nr:DUF2252 domain-containing protein [Verrucomicrobiota bacterium]